MKNKMYECMIFKYEKLTEEEKQNYQQKINDFAKCIADGYTKGKKTLVITGSGISASVPGMNSIMKKIVELIDAYDKPWNKTETFEKIYMEYINCDDSEKHQMQSQLLTYIQNAYMGREKYVQKEDLKPLSDVWEIFVIWLLMGDGDYKGVINAEISEQHRLISRMYKRMNAISITTNFDNLLSKAFDREDNFYPILDNQAFNKYFANEEDDDSYIEIQSRGDAFWLECTGTKNKICPNRHKQCYVPGKSVKIEENKIKCNLCKSDAKIYFAFPGTKEKDEEMSTIMDGVWKYFANSISCVIIIGNSMDYDPVLIEFMRELKQKRRLPILYISRYKKSTSYEDAFGKEATKFLFRDYLNTNNVWARAENTEDILKDLLEVFENEVSKDKKERYSKEELETAITFWKNRLRELFGETEGVDKVENNLKMFKIFEEILNEDKVEKMKHFSQLGLKTYWLRGTYKQYQKHNRYKHSVGVMSIASYLYLKICKEPNKQELQFLQMTALFHDLGHLPFSHLLEEVFDEFGWVSVGESKTFNHEQHTKQIIRSMIENNGIIKNALNTISYSELELHQLINGEYGKGYLDALINSPIDCDKIEYLFSDAIFMNRGTKEDFDSFIEEYVENLTINKENFLILKKNATSSFLNLIKMRGEMYDNVYLRRGLRYLEACCKLIIRTFIAYKCTEEEVFVSIKDQSKFEEYYNLSEVKIAQVVEYMEECMEDLEGKEVCELHVLEHMVKDIRNNSIISDKMKETILKCHDLIKETKSDDQVKTIEEERIVTFEVTNSKINKRSLKALLKNVYLRFPGVILVDFVESKSSFSFGKRETRRMRSDGTKSATENILIKDIKQVKGYPNDEYRCLGDVADIVNAELHYPNHSYINIYRITDDLFYYMQAEDYIIHELRKEGIINEK